MRRTGGDKDIAALIELLKMAEEQWPCSRGHQVSQTELFCRDQTLLEMWPEACRRTGVGQRQFPDGVLSLWKEGMGLAQ